MRSGLQKLAVSLAMVALSITLTVGRLAADSKSQTFSGEVSDAMCGAKHMGGGAPADCTKACVKQGSKYALVVGDKVYTLESGDKAVTDKLDSMAGQKVKVKGMAKGDTINVTAVMPGQ